MAVFTRCLHVPASFLVINTLCYCLLCLLTTGVLRRTPCELKKNYLAIHTVSGLVYEDIRDGDSSLISKVTTRSSYTCSSGVFSCDVALCLRCYWEVLRSLDKGWRPAGGSHVAFVFVNQNISASQSKHQRSSGRESFGNRTLDNSPGPGSAVGLAGRVLCIAC